MNKITTKKNIANCRLKTANLLSPLLFAFCLIVFTSVTTATIRYVSHTGTSTPPYTTWETAADSIQKAINICNPGDTVIVANSVYKENLVINTQISLIGSSMDSTTVDGTGLGDYTIIFNASGSIENFNIYGKGEVTWTNGVIWSSTQNTFIRIENCFLRETGWGISCVNSSLVANNLLISNMNGGIALASAIEVDFNISNCTIIANRNDSEGISFGFAANASALITNNIILFTGTNNPGYGILVGALKEIHIYNNLISGFSFNIFFDTVTDTAFIKNNILINQSAFGSTASIWSSANRIFTNNTILSKNLRGIYQAGSGFIRSDYNIFWKNNIDLTGVFYGDSDRVADPMFVHDTIPAGNGNLPDGKAGYDFHLQAFSPGIDKGNPDILDVDGTRSDIGLYGGLLGQSYKYKDLPPKPPVNFSAAADTDGIFFKWNRNSEADTSHYNVYRDNKPDFTIDSTKLIASPVDTFYVDTITIKENLYYKITCVDNQGNESDPSEEIMIKPVSADEYPYVVNDYILYQNYPNPFNPATTIGYKLKERGYVKLMVYDITGSLVSVLVNKEQETGYYEVEFNVKSQKSIVKNDLASGIYLYRIEVIGEGNIPVYSDMKKMILVK